MSAFDPDLSILPAHQRAIWSELSVVPSHFVLYGGTAIALLRSGISLEDGLGAARALYGAQFNAAITLKALVYFEDGDLPSLPRDVRMFLSGMAARIGSMPEVARASLSLAPEESVGL